MYIAFACVHCVLMHNVLLVIRRFFCVYVCFFACSTWKRVVMVLKTSLYFCSAVVRFGNDKRNMHHCCMYSGNLDGMSDTTCEVQLYKYCSRCIINYHQSTWNCVSWNKWFWSWVILTPSCFKRGLIHFRLCQSDQGTRWVPRQRPGTDFRIWNLPPAKGSFSFN